jgi:YD repeat-containing protein
VESSVYDSDGRVICQWDPDGRETTFSWVDDGLGDGLVSEATMTDPKGNVTDFEFNAGELVSKTVGYGTSSAATWSYGYDPVSLGMTWSEDPDGNVTTATFDGDGNMLSQTDPEGNTTTWTYNSYNEVTSETPPATYGSYGTVTTSYSYDQSAYSSGGAGNLTSVSTPIVLPSGTDEGTQVTHYVHGDSSHPGDVTSVVDPDGNTTTYTYDSYGDKTSETAPATSDNSDVSGSYQDVTRWAYNTSTGWVTSEMSGRYMLAHSSATSCSTPATGCTTYTYNNEGQVLTTTDGNGHVTTNTYDADGNLTSTTDPDGNETTSVFDPAGQQTSSTSAAGTSEAETSSTSYWPDGSVETQTDPSGDVTSYTYDPLGDQTAVTDPDGRTTSYVYDGDGNLLVKSNPGVSGCTVSSTTSGCTISTYDAEGQLTGIVYNNTDTSNVTYSYDADGREVSMVDGTGTSSWSFDSLGRLVSTTDGAGSTTSYGYDDAGNQTSISYPDSLGTVTKTYDAQGREESMEDWDGHTTTFSYDADGDLTSGSDPTSGSNPVVDTTTYDPAGQVSGMTTTLGSSTLTSEAYTRDANGQVTSETDTGLAGSNQSFG